MRKSLFFGAVVLVLVAFSPAAFADTCSCTAPDGSCNTSVSCGGGCAAICGEGGNCSSWCSGSGTKGPLHDAFQAEPGNSSAGGSRVNLEASELTAEEVSALLSSLTSREISFAPNKPGERLTISASDFPIHELIQALGNYGAIASAPARASNQADVDDRVSLQASKVTGLALEAVVRSLSGGRASFTAARPEGLVNLEVKNMPIQELLEQLTLLGQVTLDGQPLLRQ